MAPTDNNLCERATHFKIMPISCTLLTRIHCFATKNGT